MTDLSITELIALAKKSPKKRPTIIYLVGQRAMTSDSSDRRTACQYLASILSSENSKALWPQVCKVMKQLDYKPAPLPAFRAFLCAESREALRITADTLAMFETLPNNLLKKFEEKIAQIRAIDEEDQCPMKLDTALLRLLEVHLKPRFV